MKQYSSAPNVFGTATLVLALVFGLPLAGQDEAGTELASVGMTEKGGDLWVYFDLGCSDTYWGGFFAPHRWNRQVGEEKDSFSESSTNAQFSVDRAGVHFPGNREETQVWSIEIPASGYLSFHLAPSEGIKISINQFVENYDNRDDSLYYSPFLYQGDRFSVSIPSGENEVFWDELRFHTNATGVFLHPEVKRLSDRYRPVETSRIDRVFFPTDGTGRWPVFDYDGDFSSSEDQIELKKGNEHFRVNYHDEPVLIEGQYFLLREFTVTERCVQGNSVTNTQRWWPVPLLPKY